MRRLAFLFLAVVFMLSACDQNAQPALPQPATVTPTPTATLISTPTPTQTATSTPTPIPIDPAKLGTVERDVTYCTVNGVPIKMDVYYPATATGPWPAVIIVHGGAWITGDKATTASLAIQPGLTARGILVFSINYRLAPAFPWPSMIEDAKCAVRSLRANARDYNLDPNRIGIEGDSVGAQIALLVGLADRTADWDVGQYLEYSSQVQAVVDFFGPTDLNDSSLYDLVSREGRRAFHYVGWKSSELIKASPVTYARKDAPPIFIAHGDLDRDVRFAQSQMFYDKMKALGAPITLVKIKNGIHSFGSVAYQVTPTYSEVYAMSVNFLVDELTSASIAAIPTIAATATATPSAFWVEAKDISVYCRYGPSLDYSPVGFLEPGNLAPVAGTVEDHSWWEIHNPSKPETTCWVANSVTKSTGDPSGLPIVAAPNGIAIGVKVSLTPVIHGCSGYTNIFEGTITTNGPSVIAYHWEVYNPLGELVDIYPDATLVFHTAGAQKVTPGAFSGDFCGTFTVRLVVTYPNRLQGQATYDVK